MMTYKLSNLVERKYYKYTDQRIVSCPNSNYSGLEYLTNFSLLGNDNSLGVKASSYYSTNYPWHVLDSSSSTLWVTNTGYPTWVAFSFPKLFKLEELTVITYSVNFPRSGTLDYSDDGENWETATSWTTNVGANDQFRIYIPGSKWKFCRYYRLNITSGSNSTTLDIISIWGAGDMRTVSAGTSSDYDYYEDVVNYKSSVDNGTYQAIVT